MPRPRERVCLQDGLKLDLNRLARNGFIRRGSRSGPLGIRWYSSYWDKELASCLITADMSGPREGWLQLQGDFDEQDCSHRLPPTFRRPTMVFHVPRLEPTCLGAVEAARRAPFPQSSGLGATGRVPFAVQ